MVNDDGRLFLLQELTIRKNRNTSYSLRAFARDLGVSPTALSQYLSRQRELSRKNRAAVVDRLRLSPTESRLFAGSAAPATKAEAIEAAMAEDTFRLIGDWVSLATLNLARLKTNRADAGWIARRLGVPVHEGEETLERLRRLELIQVKQGRMVRTAKPIMTTTDVPSGAIKKFHLGLLRKAEEALLQTPVELRDITAITMPVDPDKLDEAKKILRQTSRKIAEKLSAGEATEVYVLAMQLFPVTESRDEGNEK